MRLDDPMMPGQMNPDPMNPMMPGTGNPDPVKPSARGVVDGIRIPQMSISLSTGSVGLAAQAIWLASSSGTVTTTGTLRQQGNAFSYEASPTDRLVIDWTEGPDTSFVIKTFQGDLSSTPENFLDSNHDFAFQITREGIVNLNISTARRGTREDGTAQGTVTREGVTYNVNLTRSSDVDASAEPNGTQHRSLETITGTITAPGFEVNVQEGHRYALIVVDSAVTNVTRTINNTWTSQGSSYALQDLFIRYETLDGWPNVTDFWKVGGSILKDGSVIGGLEYRHPNNLWVELNLVLGQERHELERWMLRQ